MKHNFSGFKYFKQKVGAKSDAKLKTSVYLLGPKYGSLFATRNSRQFEPKWAFSMESICISGSELSG